MIDPVTRSNIESTAQSELQRRSEVAQQFEGILMARLLAQVSNTIGNWDGEDDAAAQQIQGLFWLQLADHVGRNGGFGFWTQILQQINQEEASDILQTSLDEVL